MSHMYMVVTADEYELPVFVAYSTREMARILGTTHGAVSKAVKLQSVRRSPPAKDCRIIRVEVGDE